MERDMPPAPLPAMAPVSEVDDVVRDDEINEVDPTNPLVGTRWEIMFDLGREEGTWMPPRWAASGIRYEFSLLVRLGGSASVAAAAKEAGAASVAAWFDDRVPAGGGGQTRRDKYE